MLSERLVARPGHDGLALYAEALDADLKRANSDYAAKRTAGLAMSAPRVHVLPAGTFEMWLRSRGKVGGQHKVPRLSNQRTNLAGVLALAAFAPPTETAKPVDKTAGEGGVGFGLER